MADSVLLPPPIEQEWLVAALANLVRRRGPEPLVSAPLVLAEASFFPDYWTPDEAGVRRLLVRLLGYAGLPDAKVDVEVVDSGRPEMTGWGGERSYHHAGAAGWFMGIHRGVYLFGVDPSHLEDAATLVAVLSHETAHAWRRRWALEVDDRDHEERLTDLTTVYLGFGVLTANAAWQFRSGQEGLKFGWSKARAGYLPFQSFAWLLALLAHARGLGWWERKRLGWRLSPNQRGAFEQSYSKLAADRAAVLRELGVDR